MQDYAFLKKSEITVSLISKIFSIIMTPHRCRCKQDKKTEITTSSFGDFSLFIHYITISMKIGDYNSAFGPVSCLCPCIGEMKILYTPLLFHLLMELGGK